MERARRTRGPVRPDAILAETTLTIMSKHAGKDETKPVALEVRKFETEPAYVRVSAGMTKNMGNYESLRVDIAISMPCYEEEIDAVLPKVADKVAAYLDEELKNYQGD